MRIVEKVLHNHCQWLFNYKGSVPLGKRSGAGNRTDEAAREKRIARVQRVLKEILGLHSYEFKEDTERPG
jgi:hypothetical protein